MKPVEPPSPGASAGWRVWLLPAALLLGGVLAWLLAGAVVLSVAREDDPSGEPAGIPTFAPTAVAAGLTPAAHTPTPEPSATLSATWTPTATDSGTTATPTWTPTFTETPAAVATLNFSLPPVYGSSALTSGFVPDPFSVGVSAGGPANVSYLGGGCSGYATSAPTFSINYTSGAFPTLRFYFIGSSDTTMIVNTPSGSYFCVDDSFGTLNPTLDFQSPSSGRYDVWIGAFNAGGSVGGTLYVTENSANHP